VEIPGGRGVIKDPLGTEIPKGWGDANQKTFRGRGMDIFWNHTIWGVTMGQFLGLFWNENRQNGNYQNYWNMKQEKMVFPKMD